MATSLSDAEIREILKSKKRIAVIGLSPVAARPSYGVTRYMIAQGYEIFGVRPGTPPEILGRPCVESLAQLNEDVDILDIFRNSEAIPEVVAEIETWMNAKKDGAKKPTVLWLQEGIIHPQAEARAEQLGLKVISNRCILKEHARLL
jgi:predicted CoA-binding protein